MISEGFVSREFRDFLTVTRSVDELIEVLRRALP